MIQNYYHNYQCKNIRYEYCKVMINKYNVDSKKSKFSGRIMPKDDGAFIERTSSHGRNVSATRVVFTDSPVSSITSRQKVQETNFYYPLLCKGAFSTRKRNVKLPSFGRR